MRKKKYQVKDEKVCGIRVVSRIKKDVNCPEW